MDERSFLAGLRRRQAIDYIINLWTNVIFKFISVVDLNLGKKLSWYGGLVKIPLAQVPLAGKLKSLL
jgi:hypothetical protein